MIPKVAYILGAGLGTRMGRVGKRIPKPLWPVGSHSLLEIVLCQIQSWGIEEVFLNCHHQHLFVQEYVKQKQLSLKLIYEPELLGSGGCYANLKSLIGPQRILACNADSLYFLDKKSLLRESEKYREGHLLFSRKVSVDSGYNGLLTNKENRLTQIRPPPFEREYRTFSGLSLVDLSLVNGPIEPSSFFQSVAEPGPASSYVSFAEADFFDFGTLEDYIRQLLALGGSGELSPYLERLGLTPFEVRSKGYLKASGFEMHYNGAEVRLEFKVLNESAQINHDLSSDL